MSAPRQRRGCAGEPASHQRQAQVQDRTMRVLVVMAFLLALIPLTWVLWTTVSRGSDWS